MKWLGFTHGLVLAAMAVVSLGVAIPARADTSIQIPANVPRAGAFWGPQRPSFGQTFKAPSDNVLDSFTFYGLISLAPHNFKGYVMAWDGTEPIGPALYESDVLHLAPSDYTHDLNVPAYDYTFDTGGIQLASGQEYIAMLSISGVPGNNSAVEDLDLRAYGYGYGPFPADNPYPDGSLYMQQTWDTGSEWLRADKEDAEFNAQFSPASVKEQAQVDALLSPASAPEPNSLALLALTGVPLLGILGRRARR